MTKGDYSNRELDHIFDDIKETLSRIEAQTTKTNGRVTLLEKILLVIGVASATAVLIYYPEVISAIKLFI